MDASKRPLCVDCDGTLIRTDLLHESALALLKTAPLRVLGLPVWLLRGKAHLKQKLSMYVNLDVKTLPYNPELLGLLRAARAEGRETVLVTSSPRVQADAVAAHLGLFDRVEATEGGINLSGARKAQRLISLFGSRGFDYAGNSRDDLPVWDAAAGAIVVNASASVRGAAERAARVVKVLHRAPLRLTLYARALRLHQWMKNLLVLVPMLAAHQFTDAAIVAASLLAFIAFSLCASAVYVLNDLLDLPSDRQHVRKRERPFASGAMPLWHGVLMVPLLLFASAAVAVALPGVFGAALAGYLVLTCLYSFWLKSQVMVDVLLLAGLYTSRLIAGAAATHIVPSFWLLAFSMFMFLSLAMVKRYSELLVIQKEERQQAAGRGYFVSDLPVLMSLGASSGYLAILVMALYLNSSDVMERYANRDVLWLTLPLLLYWISRVWMKAHRAEMHDDPVVFAGKDWQSWAILLSLAALLTLATL